KIFNEKLFITSKKKDINSIQDLNNNKVYLAEGSIYEEFLEVIINNNDLKTEMVLVDDTVGYEDKFVLESNLSDSAEKNKIMIGNVPSSSIAVINKHAELVPIINNAMKEYYSDRINKWFQDRRHQVFKKNFEESLTIDEKNYLKNIKKIDIAYEELGEMSYFSNEKLIYEGVVPKTLKMIFHRIDIFLDDKSKPAEEWSSIFNRFKTGKVDLITLSKTKNREQDFLFTTKIFDLNIYKVNSLKDSLYSKKRIGVIKDTRQEEILRRYYLEEDIVTYNNHNKMIKDFEANKIYSIVIINPEDFEIGKYIIEILDTIPVNLGLNKKNILLRDILDKAINNLLDKNDIIEAAKFESRREKLNKLEIERKRYSGILIIVIFTIVIITIQSYRLNLEENKNKELLKDELTGLLSRRVFNEFCDKNNEIEGSILVLDLNNFKKINDFHGHSLGDEVIVEASKCLKNIFSKDKVFRISGDEFYMYSYEKYEIEEKIWDLKEAFKSSKLLRRFGVNFSLGYCIKEQKNSLKEAFKNADMAMYFVKKNKHLWYKEATKDFIKSVERKEIIRKSLEGVIESEFFAVYQPKFNLKTNTLEGAEALARWDSSELGFVSPVEFIPLAEEVNLVYRIDYKIAEESIKKIRHILDKEIDIKDFRISFNVSPETFRKENIVSYIENLLEKYSVDGRYLEIEITESMFISDIKDIITKLNALKSKGIRISIDDFTAGYSTTGLLATLPVDTVKFDRSLMLSIAEDEKKGKAIYIGLIKMMKSLSLKIVSEGIETESELEFLKENGVDYGQGFYLGRPTIDFYN
ncbi:MAG: EAL domain-containing protein, partial [Cetobacterium sp.]